METFSVAVTVNGHENIGGRYVSFPEAQREARRSMLSEPRRLRSYRVEIVENFGDRSRFVVFDLDWR